MKLSESKTMMDEFMADVPVSGGVSTETTACNTEAQDDSLTERPQTPPSRSPSQLAAARRSRRNSVQMACERCRRRKIRCSGLPGPCHSCVRLNVACHDPGRKKDRAQSILEDRIQRLEALALANKPFGPMDTSTLISLQVNQPQNSTPIIAQPQPRYAQQIQTQNVANLSSSFDDFGQLSPMSSYSWEGWQAPRSPACHSDQGPDLSYMWPQVDYFQQMVDNTPSPNPIMHKRAQTFPTIKTDDAWQIPADEAPKSAGAFSDIPSIEITSYDSSRPQTPHFNLEEPMSPAGITIPYRSSLTDQDDDFEESRFELPVTPPLSPITTRNHEESPVEYYGDLLSPLDQPPPAISRRSSTTSSDFNTSMYNSSDATASYVFSGSRTRTHRAQTLPTAMPADQETQQYISMTMNSPRTRNYAHVYFKTVHLEYPFLDPSTFHTNRSLAYRASGITSDPSQRLTTIPYVISSYQTLLVAAIGAMVHHQSRSLSSRHVRHAMSLHPQIDMWSSISGLHCAMLLSIYCYLEATMSFNDEDDGNDEAQQKPHFSQPLHPSVNMWLHNCQVSAACIDLGMHVALAEDDEPGMHGIGKQVANLARNTFRSAYTLDKKISELRNRPTALHDGDLDPTLIAGL